MGKQRNKKKQHSMDVEKYGGASAAAAEWQTGPSGQGDDFIGMDTAEAGAAAATPPSQPQPRQPQAKRGSRSSKQKERKRKSLEKALAVADRKETKVGREGAKGAAKKVLKKLWEADAKGAR